MSEQSIENNLGENKKVVKNIFSPQIQIFEPFGAHVDPSRTNMSAKQILQSVTSRMTEVPFILNKAFRDFTEIKSPYTYKAPRDGIILNNSNNILFMSFLDSDGKNTFMFEYIPQVKKIQAHALHLRYVRPLGQFKAGDLLYDYTGQTESGLPRIGYRTKVLFGSFLGYTAEDAMVISESFSKKAQIDYFEKLYIPISKKIKYIKNENGKYFYEVGEFQSKNFSKYIKIDPTLNYDAQFLNISEKDSRYYLKYIEGLEGAEIKEVKLHKITKETFQTISGDYLYSPDLIKELSELHNSVIKKYLTMTEEYKNLNIKGLNAQNIVSSIFGTFFTSAKLPSKLLSEVAENFGIIDKDIDYILEIDICQTVPTVLGDKFANCFAGKGTISMIIPDKLMPIDQNGERIDLIFNPLGIYGRNNWGSIFELGLSNIIKDVEKFIKDKEQTKDRLQFINDYFLSKIDHEYYTMVNYMLNSWDYYYPYFQQDVEKIGFYLNVDNFPEFPYERFYHEFIKLYSEKFGIIVDKQKFLFSKELANYVKQTRNYELEGLEEHEDIYNEAYIGDSYYLKLFHTSSSKYNAVSIAKSYNKVSGQPAKGKKKNGGQHTSWMTDAAGLGHSDHSYIMKELKTIKSDCLLDKEKFVLDMAYLGKYQMKDSGYDSKVLETINHALSAQFGMKFGYTGEAVETSRATEAERINNTIALDKINLNFEDFKKQEEIIFNDFNLDELDLKNIGLDDTDLDYIEKL